MLVAQRKEGGKQKVVFELQVPREGEQNDVHRYLVPRLSQLDTLEAQKVRAKLIDDDQRDVTTGSMVLTSLFDRVEPIDGAKKFTLQLRDMEDEGFDIDPIVQEVIRVASTDITTLIAENLEVRE